MIVNVEGRQLDATVLYRYSDSAWGGRPTQSIRVEMTYDEAKHLFVDDVKWSCVLQFYDDTNTLRDVETDMSEYAISGAITDNRDGTVTVKMGKYTDEELLRVPLGDAPKTHTSAVQMRRIIEDSVQNIESDINALAVKDLYPEWSKLVGKTVDSGFRFAYHGGLFKVLQSHTINETWVPGVGTESLYTRLDDTHTGSKDDPVPYVGNMRLVVGLYYIQNDELYQCVRDSINPVYNPLSDLVGLYVQVVSA